MFSNKKCVSFNHVHYTVFFLVMLLLATLLFGCAGKKDSDSGYVLDNNGNALIEKTKIALIGKTFSCITGLGTDNCEFQWITIRDGDTCYLEQFTVDKNGEVYANSEAAYRIGPSKEGFLALIIGEDTYEITMDNAGVYTLYEVNTNSGYITLDRANHRDLKDYVSSLRGTQNDTGTTAPTTAPITTKAPTTTPPTTAAPSGDISIYYDVETAWTTFETVEGDKIVTTYAFNDGGRFYCMVGYYRSDVIALYHGVYEVSGEDITFRYWLGNEWLVVHHYIDTVTLTLTQTSEVGLFLTHEKGEVFPMQEDEWFTADDIQQMVIAGAPALPKK